MGLNAYFAYQVVGFHGSGIIPYNLALTAVFIEGFIFIGLSLIGMRQWLVKIIPNSLKIATACGIGLFLALIGLSDGVGISVISGAKNTPLELSGCPNQYKDDMGVCTSHKMTSPTVSYLPSFLKQYIVDLVSIAVDWPHVWRYHYRLLDDVQSQKRHDHWHVDRLHNSVAVSSAAPVQRLHTHIGTGEALRSLTSPTLRWVTTAGSILKRSHTSILSTTL
jgi:hypothetical protein